MECVIWLAMYGNGQIVVIMEIAIEINAFFAAAAGTTPTATARFRAGTAKAWTRRTTATTGFVFVVEFCFAWFW
jgi:hypothetical protein